MEEEENNKDLVETNQKIDENEDQIDSNINNNPQEIPEDQQNEEGEEIEDDEEGEEIEDEQDIPNNEFENKEEEEQNSEEEKVQENKSQVSSSKGFGEKSESGETKSQQEESLGESNEDEDDDETLPPERKIRYRLFKFINKMRIECHMIPYTNDLLANNLAMLYANYLLNNKENEEELKNLAKKLNIRADYKVSSLDSFIDSDGIKLDKNSMKKYKEFADEFFDVQATLIEFQEHGNNILSEKFNTVGIGMAINEMKVVVVNIFLRREIMVNSCSINFYNGSIIINGELMNDQYGAYAARIINPSNPNKSIAFITPQHITPSNATNKIRPFTAAFNNVERVLEDQEPKNIEIYIRVKPDLIPYSRIFSDKIHFEDLTLGAVIPLISFPNDKERKEEKRQDKKDEKVANDHLELLADYERRKDEEKKRRMKIDIYAYAKSEDEMDEIKEEVDEDLDEESKEEISRKSSIRPSKIIGVRKSVVSRFSKSKDEISQELGLSSSEKKQNYEQEIQDLEEKIEKLKEDNELCQRKINLIYEFRKKEGREEKNFYKESNINESTYADSLSSTAGLYNDLNMHKRKLEEDLARYQQSIDEQEKRKQDVYDILMKYKEELLENAETRKGKKIPRAEIENWLGREKELEDELKKVRILSFTKNLEMNRLKKELKKTEDYFEGLHIIDFEQLKIENNTLTEKIEDRNEEIHKIKNKINISVQELAHLQEKSHFISSQNGIGKSENENLKKDIFGMKKKLTKRKEDNDKKALKRLNKNKKIEQINSEPLKNYYKNIIQHIQELSIEIDEVGKQLLEFRQKRKGNKKDITELLQRKEKFMREFRTLPKAD